MKKTHSVCLAFLLLYLVGMNVLGRPANSLGMIVNRGQIGAANLLNLGASLSPINDGLIDGGTLGITAGQTIQRGPLPH